MENEIYEKAVDHIKYQTENIINGEAAGAPNPFKGVADKIVEIKLNYYPRKA